jgi:acetyltransferase-like isoleucine patch superfamily enzyme
LGENCLLSNEIDIRSGDGHAIYNSDKKRLNPDKDINIGNHGWIGKRVMILKGVSIAEGCIVGAGSLVNKQFLEKKCVIAGNPAKVIKHEIAWKR